VKLGPDEQRAIEEALSILPARHPARLAAEQGADPVMLIHLIDRDDVAEALESIWYRAYRKRLTRTGADA
jgi:hypothetical protein